MVWGRRNAHQHAPHDSRSWAGSDDTCLCVEFKSKASKISWKFERNHMISTSVRIVSDMRKDSSWSLLRRLQICNTYRRLVDITSPIDLLWILQAHFDALSLIIHAMKVGPIPLESMNILWTTSSRAAQRVGKSNLQMLRAVLFQD